MLFIWGKRTYGAADKVGNVSVKTMFGHFWYLPLFPKTSYYVEAKSGKAFELNGLRWRSVLFGYLRVWGAVCAVIAFLHARSEEGTAALPAYLLCALATAAVIGSYFYDRKTQREEVRQLRLSMEKNFGVALDPYECLESLQQEITAKAQANSVAQLDEDWHKQTIRDPFSDQHQLELALLRARCDRQDQVLQQEVLKKVASRRE
ncbi:hypothetical protein GTP58_25060 [Duganella sp. CY15W]|uniref:hypothetical protein n=1 Tax=Duganella sp. CY15W TaxID=2692172 RepID=UPI00136B4512|nr:hypothetical protein [Duganella sp. CY15W]MYM31605.1 hypothetical protein [Duganella sp. CY15W]